MTNLSPRIRSYLDTEYGPVIANFTLDKKPEVVAPLRIREQWLGIPLPVREKNLGKIALSACKNLDLPTSLYLLTDEPVSIVGLEAVDALVEANRLDAVRYWLPHHMEIFTFRTTEGHINLIE